MKPTFQILVVVVAVVGLTTGAAFAGGVLYGRESTPASDPAQAQAATAGAGGVTRIAGAGQGGGGQPGAATIGVIEQVDGQTMTVKKQDGTSVSVSLQPDTQVMQNTPAAVTDLQPGMPVTVAGQPGSAGTIAARSVQIGGRGGPMVVGGTPPSPSASPAASPAP
ncbi:MAG: DUF5666 domain-containing protein [Dehalococcoidia bacterium]